MIYINKLRIRWKFDTLSMNIMMTIPDMNPETLAIII